jgi:hypothetical protein
MASSYACRVKVERRIAARLVKIRYRKAGACAGRYPVVEPVETWAERMGKGPRRPFPILPWHQEPPNIGERFSYLPGASFPVQVGRTETSFEATLNTALVDQ